MGNCFTTTRSNSVHVSTAIHCICSHACVGLAVHRPADHTTLPPLSLSYQLNTIPVQQTPGAQPRVSPKCQLLELSSTALPAVPTLSLFLHCIETVLTACSPRGLPMPLAPVGDWSGKVWSAGSLPSHTYAGNPVIGV